MRDDVEHEDEDGRAEEKEDHAAGKHAGAPTKKFENILSAYIEIKATRASCQEGVFR
jgi:hypothetical protein